ncbi:MAG: MFS transporter [Chloroflexi bacterium]|nr:MFS transporter [Chloroflexota bacterium]
MWLRTGTFAALRHRNYRIWFIGQAITLTGTWMQSIATSWLVYQMTGSELALGLISFINSVPPVLLMLPAGALADRLSRRKLLIITQTTFMASAVALALLSALGLLQVWHIAAAAVVSGLASSFAMPTRHALVVELVDDRRDLMNAIALNSTIFSLSKVIGPALGGVILAALGATWCFGLNAVGYLGSLTALFLIRLPEQPLKPKGAPLAKEILDGLRYVLANVSVRTMMALIAVSGTFAASFTVLMPVYATDVFDVGKTGLGAMNAANGVGALIGSLLVASTAQAKRQGFMLTIGNLAAPALLLIFAFCTSYRVSLVFLVLVGASQILQNAVVNTLIQSSTPDALRGRVMGLYSLIMFGNWSLGTLLMGAVAQSIGAPPTVAIGAAITLAFGLVIYFTVPHLRRLQAGGEM